MKRALVALVLAVATTAALALPGAGPAFASGTCPTCSTMPTTPVPPTTVPPTTVPPTTVPPTTVAPLPGHRTTVQKAPAVGKPKVVSGAVPGAVPAAGGGVPSRENNSGGRSTTPAAPERGKSTSEPASTPAKEPASTPAKKPATEPASTPTSAPMEKPIVAPGPTKHPVRRQTRTPDPRKLGQPAYRPIVGLAAVGAHYGAPRAEQAPALVGREISAAANLGMRSLFSLAYTPTSHSLRPMVTALSPQRATSHIASPAGTPRSVQRIAGVGTPRAVQALVAPHRPPAQRPEVNASGLLWVVLVLLVGVGASVSIVDGTSDAVGKEGEEVSPGAPLPEVNMAAVNAADVSVTGTGAHSIELCVPEPRGGSTGASDEGDGNATGLEGQPYCDVILHLDDVLLWRGKADGDASKAQPRRKHLRRLAKAHEASTNR